MKKSKLGILGLLILFLCSSLSSGVQDEEKSLALSLEDCVLKAIENNLGLAIEILNPQLADIAVARAKEKFMPSLSFDFNRQSQETASYSWLDAAGTSTTDFNSYRTQISQIIPTGGNLSLILDSSRYDTNRTGNLINPSYRSTLRFNFTQPLLKDFGLKNSRKDIIVARNNLDRSDNNLQKSLQDTIYNVETAYWNLVFAIESLKVTQQSLELAQDLLEKNRRAVEVGTMAPIDILTAQTQVAEREAEILSAEAEVQNQGDRLKTIINLEADIPEADLLKIIPQDTPHSEKREISLDQALATAMQNRPDLEASRINLQNSEI